MPEYGTFYTLENEDRTQAAIKNNRPTVDYFLMDESAMDFVLKEDERGRASLQTTSIQKLGADSEKEKEDAQSGSINAGSVQPSKSLLTVEGKQ